MQQFIVENWHILSATVIVIVWLVRLEGKVIQQERRVTNLEMQHEIIEQMALDIREMKTDIRWIKENKKV